MGFLSKLSFLSLSRLTLFFSTSSTYLSYTGAEKCAKAGKSSRECECEGRELLSKVEKSPSPSLSLTHTQSPTMYEMFFFQPSDLGPAFELR